jgi:hypothetical protein
VVSGNVSGVWSKNESPYLVNGDLKILAGSSLFIEPGVRIVFQGYYKLDVAGELKALGRKNDSIVFTVNDTTGFYDVTSSSGAWNGIIVSHSGRNDLFLNCCIFEFAKESNYNAGAIDLMNLNGDIEITNSVFRNNIGYNGGAIFYNGMVDNGNIYITNCTFIQNQAVSGGALSIESFSHLRKFSYNTFINNKATNDGGAMRIQANEISNCLFLGNHAGLNGGAVWEGGSSSLKIYNSIFDNNSAPNGGVYCANFGVYSGLYNCTLINNNSNTATVFLGANSVFNFDIINSIIWNPNSPEIIFSSSSTTRSIENSIIRNAKDSAWFSTTCLDLNPLLNDTGFFKYYPTDQSPCIDKGNNNYVDNYVDFNNKCRIWDGKNNGSKIVDIGAVEFNSADSLPVIKNNSNDTVVCSGSQLLLDMNIDDKGNNFKIQWFYNLDSLKYSSVILKIDSITKNNSGYYFCRISNKYGEVQSNIIKVTVEELPEKPQQPYGSDYTITNLIDSSFYETPKINNSGLISWELYPSNTGNLIFNDTLAFIRWNKSFVGSSYLLVKNNMGHCFSISDKLKLIIEHDIVNVQKIKSNEQILYPNPTSDKFFINFSKIDVSEFNLLIIDNLGRILRKESFQNKKSINEYILPHGIYYVIIQSNNKILYSDKVVVN